MIVIGLGARKGVDSKEVIDAIGEAISESGHHISQVKYLASAKLKENESGLIEASHILGIELKFIPHDVLNNYNIPTPSQANRFGLIGVAEPAALALSQNKKLVFKKRVYGRITVAIAE
ncbi:cobalamin biosynthesis protein [Methanosalsum natronophilum]|nr:cobalamin biosynthesis protein [Methanosalsum natronophilum]MCS3924229.1 cobalt-precorrin 5A hydrolase [Methanosalsum natronophilum]